MRAQLSGPLRRWSTIAWWIAELRWSAPPVLPNTYLAPGLLIRHGLVDGGYLEIWVGGQSRICSRQAWEAGSSGCETANERLVREDRSPFSRAGNSLAFPWDFAGSSSASATLAPGAIMNERDWTDPVHFPSDLGSQVRARTLRKDLLTALRVSGSP